MSKYPSGVPAIEIRRKQSDLSLLLADPLASSTPSSAQSLASTGGTRTTSTSETTSGNSSGSGGNGNSNRLSPGAVAGICVGALLAIVLTVGGLIIWLRYRKKHLGHTTNTEPQVPQLDGQPVSELGLTPPKGSENQNQVSPQQYPERYELDTEKRPPVVVELPGERYVDPAVELHTVPVVNNSAAPQVTGERPEGMSLESTQTPAPGPEQQDIANENPKHSSSLDKSRDQEIEQLLKQQ